MRQYFDQTVMPLWRTYSSPGHPLRETSDKALRSIYGLWLVAFILKLMGSGWDVAWHFHFLRDDLAPPHLINGVGTMLVVGLVMFHTWTGYGVDRLSLRLMQAGIATFILAIPLDLLNHRIFGLDITAWSPTHAMLYLGTAIMLLGVLRGCLLLAPAGGLRTGLALGFWAFLLEDLMFPLGQQEYGVLSWLAIRNGTSTADAELLAVAGPNPEQFIVPVPAWVYPIWIVAVVPLVMLAARMIMGRRWTATTITGMYLLYRVISYYVLLGINFPPSFIPFLLLAGAVAIDVSVTFNWRPILGTLAATGAFYGAAWLTQRVMGVEMVPPFDLGTAPLAAVLLWSGWSAVRWAQISPLMARWSKPA